MEVENTEFQYAEGAPAAPEATEPVTTREPEGQTPVEQESLADLSTYSRFKLGEKEYTREQLEKGFMFQSDYTKKSQELAQERKFYTNLQADLEKVKGNPALAASFKEIYPKQFHHFLGYVSRETNSQTSNPNANSKPEVQSHVDPRLDQVLSKVEMLEKERYEERISQNATHIDSMFTKFSAKYPLATPEGDENYVLNKAQAIAKDLDPGQKMTDEQWEKIFKEASAHYTKAFENHYKTRFNNQKAAHVRGKDIGSGGGIPGGAPQMPRTIKEASRIAEEDFTRR